MPEAAPLEPGDPTSIGHFEITGRLGAGGQGAVYLGRAPGGEHVAIKLLHVQTSAGPAARARFTREVAAAQKVAPFCTARVLESDVHGDQPYIVSEFIEGPSLHDVVAQGRLFGPDDLDRLAIGTVTALAAIHEAGIVHRDFKPNNVLLATDGPRVVDFGIARTINSQESAVTATGMVVGTPGYLAPEQLTGTPLTPAVDIFAWAATMVFAATGRSPFEADTLPVIINRILHEEPDLSTLRSPLRELVGRCLSKEPVRRPAAHELLLQLLGHAGAAPGPAPAPEELLNEGTRIAAQMPAPPLTPITPPPQALTPPPQAVTPPPQAVTPPPQAFPQGPPPIAHGPATPPPMPMYQAGPMTPPPMHAPHMGPHRPPPRRSGATGPIIAGAGCLVAALVTIFIIGLVAAIPDKPTITYSPYSPNITPFSRTPFSSGRLNSNFGGSWAGRGYQAKGSTAGSSIRITLTSGRFTGLVSYSECSGILMVQSSNAYKTVLRQTIAADNPNCYGSGYVTLYYISSNTLKFEYRRYESDPVPWATGTLHRN